MGQNEAINVDVHYSWKSLARHENTTRIQPKVIERDTNPT